MKIGRGTGIFGVASISRMLALGVAVIGLSSQVHAQDNYPNRPIELIVGFPPGGGADSVARVVSDKLGEILKTSVVVINRPGASGQIANEYVWRSEPDGYTFLISPQDLLIGSHLRDLSYDPMKDLRAISQLTSTAIVMVATPSFPADDVAGLVKLSEEGSRKIHYGSSGVGGPNYLAGEMFNQMAGANLISVPYPGTGAVIPAVMSGEVDLMFGFVPGLVSYVESKSVKPLAVSSPERSPALPDVPTMQEAGIDGYEMTAFIGLFATAKTPDEIVTRVHDAVVEALNDPGVSQKLKDQGQEVVGSTPDEFSAFLKKDDAKYAALIKSLNLKQ